MTAHDRLAALLDRFPMRTSLFYTGQICETTSFAAEPRRGYLHILRRGEVLVTHDDDIGERTRFTVDEPSLLFYPRPLQHTFHNAPAEGSDFTCAAVDFGTDTVHPLMRSLPPVVVVPLREVGGLDSIIQLLFDEVDNVRCGRRVVADKLFEILLIQLLRWMLDHAAEVGVPPGMITGLGDPQLTPALVAVHEAPNEAWTLDALARRAQMSRSAFAARFKDVVGQAPGEYLTSWRLTIAQQRLRAGVSVSQVAAELGYANASSLSRVFAQHLGSSPRDWLNASRAPQFVNAR